MRSLQLTVKEWKELKPLDRAMLQKIGFKKPKISRKKTSSALRPTAPKDYILRKILTCTCCKTVTKETYYMKYIKEENKTSWDECLKAIPVRGEEIADKEEQTTLRTCKCCKVTLEKLTRVQLIDKVIHLNRIVNYGG